MPITAAEAELVARLWVQRAVEGRAHVGAIRRSMTLLVAALVESRPACLWLLSCQGEPDWERLTDRDRRLLDLLDEWSVWAQRPIQIRRAKRPEWPTDPSVLRRPVREGRSRYDIIGGVEDGT